MKFSHLAEKISAARRAMMLPHCRDEAFSVVETFQKCMSAFRDLPWEALDDRAKNWIFQIRELIETPGIDPYDRGQWLVKARQLTEAQKRELAGAVDELAHWLEKAAWEESMMFPENNRQVNLINTAQRQRRSS